MSTTIDQVRSLLDQLALKYDVRGPDVISVIFETQKYRRPDGQKALLLIISIEEDGSYFKLFAPKAFIAAGPHVDAFLRACLMIQWMTKLIQFEFDHTDGEIRPMIEFPLMDALLTKAQLQRCLNAMCGIMDEFYECLHKALETGVVDLPTLGFAMPGGISRMLVEMALLSLRREGRAEDDPEVKALRAILEKMGPKEESGDTGPDTL